MAIEIKLITAKSNHDRNIRKHWQLNKYTIITTLLYL